MATIITLLATYMALQENPKNQKQKMEAWNLNLHFTKIFIEKTLLDFGHQIINRTILLRPKLQGQDHKVSEKDPAYSGEDAKFDWKSKKSKTENEGVKLEFAFYKKNHREDAIGL